MAIIMSIADMGMAKRGILGTEETRDVEIAVPREFQWRMRSDQSIDRHNEERLTRHGYLHWEGRKS